MYFDASYDTYKVPHAHSPKQQGKGAVTSNRVTKTSYHILAPAEPLGITPCCTLPRDKGDTFQANAQKAHSHLRFHVFLHMNTHLSCCTEMLKIVHDLCQNLITSNFDFAFKCFLWLTTPGLYASADGPSPCGQSCGEPMPQSRSADQRTCEATRSYYASPFDRP